MNRFPKPWRLEQTDPGRTFAVSDANGRKLFYICEDDPEDEENRSPGDPEGPTILGSDDDSDLLSEIEQMLEGS
jgi:hypothetical protein